MSGTATLRSVSFSGECKLSEQCVFFSLNSVLYVSLHIYSPHTHTTPNRHIHTVHFSLSCSHTHKHTNSTPQLVCMYVQSLGEERLCGVCMWWRVKQHGGVRVWAWVRVEGRSWVGRVARLGQQSARIVTLKRGHSLETWWKKKRQLNNILLTARIHSNILTPQSTEMFYHRSPC